MRPALGLKPSRRAVDEASGRGLSGGPTLSSPSDRRRRVRELLALALEAVGNAERSADRGAMDDQLWTARRHLADAGVAVAEWQELIRGREE
jgi:hypothetical protein